MFTWLRETFASISAFFRRGVWEVDLSSQGWLRREYYRSLQVLALLYRNFQADQVLLRASALTFTTILSIVPLIGIVIAILKPLGLSHVVVPRFLNFITAQSEETVRVLEQLAGNVETYIDQTNLTAVGLISFLFILVTIGSMLKAAELSFNAIWHVHRERPLFVKIRDYTFIIIITPLLLFLGFAMQQIFSDAGVLPLLIVREAFEALLGPYPALSSNASYWLQSLDTMATFGFSTLNLLPLLILWMLFTLIYVYAPYTRVPIGPGLAGGLIGAVLWSVAYSYYIDFQFGMVRYNRIYGTLASMPFSLFWLYCSWVIVLFGSEVTYVLHSLENYRQLRRMDEPSPSCREHLTLRLMAFVAHRFEEGQPAILSDLAKAHEISEPLADDIMEQLENAGLVLRSTNPDQSGTQFTLGRPAERITLHSVVQAIRTDGEIFELPADCRFEPLEKIIGDYEGSLESKLGETTVADVIETAKNGTPVVETGRFAQSHGA